jgi:hypothetical protein
MFLLFVQISTAIQRNKGVDGAAGSYQPRRGSQSVLLQKLVRTCLNQLWRRYLRDG